MSDVLPGVGGGCQNALTPLMGKGLGTCLQVGRLPAIFNAKGSVIQPVNDWLNDMCKAQDCKEKDLDKGRKAIQQHCQAEAADPTNVVYVLNEWINNYGTVRLGLCGQAQGKDWCVTNVLTTVQDTAHVEINTAFVRSVMSGGGSATGPIKDTIEQGALCTDCFASIESKLAQINGNANGTIARTAIQSCGSDFLKINGTSTNASEANSGNGNNNAAMGMNLASESIGLGIGAAALAFSTYFL